MRIQSYWVQKKNAIGKQRTDKNTTKISWFIHHNSISISPHRFRLFAIAERQRGDSIRSFLFLIRNALHFGLMPLLFRRATILATVPMNVIEFTFSLSPITHGARLRMPIPLGSDFMSLNLVYKRGARERNFNSKKFVAQAQWPSLFYSLSSRKYAAYFYQIAICIIFVFGLFYFWSRVRKHHNRHY